MEIVRSQWGIENGLHYRRDVTFHVDGPSGSRPGKFPSRFPSPLLSLRGIQGWRCVDEDHIRDHPLAAPGTPDVYQVPSLDLIQRNVLKNTLEPVIRG